MDAHKSATIHGCIIDNVAFEGLEGSTLEALWVHVAKFLELELPLPQVVQEWTYDFLVRLPAFTFYLLPVAREPYKNYNRWENIDPKLLVPISPENECPYNRYKSVPIDDNGIMGSCEHYYTRKRLSKSKLPPKVEDAVKTFGNKLVVVAARKLRVDVLTPFCAQRIPDLTIQQYIVLEAIGRSRINGETCAGPWSLLHHCKDPTILFYIKNKLKRSGYLNATVYHEVHKGRIQPTTLLTLSRFRNFSQSRETIIIKKLADLCINAPENYITMVDARKLLPVDGSKKVLKRISQTHIFRMLFQVLSIPRPNLKPKPNATPRMMLVVKFRNIDMPRYEMLSMIHEQDIETEEIRDHFPHCRFVRVGKPFYEQFYHTIYIHGAEGISQTELSLGLGLSRLRVRQLIREYVRENMIKSYVIDKGRQRIHMYVASYFTKQLEERTSYLKKLDKVICATDPHIPPITEPRLKDIPQIVATIETYTYEKKGPREGVTQRQINRRQIIIETLNEKAFVQISELRAIILQKERILGIKDDVCMKSIYRLLQNMVNKGYLRLYQIQLKHEGSKRNYRYIIHPNIGVEHEAFQQEIFKLKGALNLVIHHKLLREEAIAKAKARKMSKEQTKTTVFKKPKEFISFSSNRQPKFLISRYMHEFLYYIVVEHKNQSTFVLTEELLQSWQLSEPELNIREFITEWDENEKPVYSNLLNWRTFIPPLRIYSDKPVGWVYLLDAFDRMPLSLFNKIFRIEKNMDELLAKYLSHPVRQHYLLKQLPIGLKDRINRIQLQNVFISIIKLLNNMGLVQVTKKMNPKDPLTMWVFLNRHTELMDTTTTESGYSRINPDRNYSVVKYEFSSTNQVTHYWTSLQRISTFTKLGFRRNPNDEREHVKELTFIDTVDFDRAPHMDTGVVPGNRLGAAGLSPKLFAHIARHWSWVHHVSSDPTKARKGRIPKTISASASSKVTKIIKRITKQKSLAVKRLPTGAVVRKKSIQKHTPRDAIDRDALKNMRTLRVAWSANENEILKIARTVYLYVAAPVPAFTLLTLGKISRDIIRRFLGSNNKTSQACTRRVQFITKTKRHLPEVPIWNHVLQTNEFMQQKYGELFLRKLKQVYPNRNDFCEALVIHFILIIHFLYNYIHSDEDHVIPKFCIPNTISEFYKKYLLKSSTISKKTIQHMNPTTEMEVQIAVANNVLHSSLCCVRDKTSYSSHAFEIFKNYSEDVLNAAFQKARSSSLCIALKRKNIQLLPSHLAGPAYLLSQRYKARLSFLQIPYNVYSSSYDYFKLAVKTLFGSMETEPKKLLQLKSPHLGHLVFISEGLSQDFWQIDINLPPNILTIDAEQRSTMCAMDRIMIHYSNILDNAPTTEYTKQLENEECSKLTTVKFNRTNLSYKMYYTPYDYIAKLPTRYLHFFCALDFLGRKVDLKFSKLMRKDDEFGCIDIECPFICIMKSGNYISSIERIVKDNRKMINELKDMPPEELLSNNPSTSKCNMVVVESKNLIPIVSLFESFLREKDIANNRKDFGKLSPNLRVSMSINWRDLCNELLEYNSSDEDNYKIDELEPTLHKEERMVRAQDVFVVNLPLLTFNVSEVLKAEKQQATFHGETVPKSMIVTDLQRKSILEKIMNESYWKYTENTLESLKAEGKFSDYSGMQYSVLEAIHDFIASTDIGVTTEELINQFPRDTSFLIRALHTLSDYHLIKRVGVATFMYVHKSYIRKWIVHTFHVTRLQSENQGGMSVSRKRKHSETNESHSGKIAKLSDEGALGRRMPKPVHRLIEANENILPNIETSKDIICMKPQPWIRLNGSLNRRVLDRWMGAILTECVALSGCTVAEICSRFLHMFPVDIMFLLEILGEIGSIHLTEMEYEEVNLFSEYKPMQEKLVTELYNPELTYITAHADALMRMAIFLGDKEYAAEFI